MTNLNVFLMLQQYGEPHHPGATGPSSDRAAEAVERREREKETELQILHGAIKGRRDAVSLLDRELAYAQQVRNIQI
jgi:hypothetical protein